MRLANKVAIITGSRRGIGFGIAKKFAQEGANVIITDIDLEDCKKSCEELNRFGRKNLALKVDVSKAKDVEKMVKETIKTFGKIDILVNNAGIYIQKPLVELTEKEWDKLIDINLKGVFLCTKEVVKEMIKRRYGKIINIASIAGQVGFANSSAYCASKGGIINITRELALELAQYKINVNAIGPGVIETPMTDFITKKPEMLKGILANVPWNRVGQPLDIANAALFLASDEADYVTGHTLFVDGGWIAQ